MGCDERLSFARRYSTVEVSELIEVLSECDSGIELGWVSGTIPATGYPGSAAREMP
jgi:hypothetical protein